MTAIDALPPVTVAIPFYNAEAYLADAIRSVFAQTHTAWELLLIDDGSTDGSLAIAKSVQDPRVRVISDGLNRGLAARLNQINKLALHDYVARMDADDLISPLRLEYQLRILSQNADIDITSTGLYSIFDDCSLVGVRGCSESSISFNDLLSKRKGILHAGAMFRKAWCMRNPYDESIANGQDAELWLRAARNSDFNVLTIAEPLYIYREAGNITKAKLLRAYQLERKVLSKHIDSRCCRHSYIVKSYIKSLIVRLLNATGLLQALQRRRNDAQVPLERLMEYRRILGIVRNTSVPGLVTPSAIPEKV